MKNANQRYGVLGIAVVAAIIFVAGTARAGLLHHLRFQDSSGNGTLKDYGSVGGTATRDANNVGFYTNDTPPKVGRALARYSAEQGVNQEAYIQMPGGTGALPRLNTVGDQISILAWIKIDSSVDANQNRGIISHRRHGGNGWCLFTRGTTANYISFNMTASDGGYWVSTGQVVNRDEWTHVALTWRAGAGTGAGPDTMKLYVNGQPQSLSGTIPVGVVPLPNDIGYMRAFVYQSYNPSVEFRGSMDDLRLYDEVLTQEQIQLIMDPPVGTSISIR